MLHAGPSFVEALARAKATPRLAVAVVLGLVTMRSLLVAAALAGVSACSTDCLQSGTSCEFYVLFGATCGMMEEEGCDCSGCDCGDEVECLMSVYGFYGGALCGTLAPRGLHEAQSSPF